MKYIRFSNGDKVCAIGQDTWNMGRNFLYEKLEANALLTGINLGMNMIDTAEMYGNETFIGKVIKPCRDKVFLVSKVHPENADYRGTVNACEKSLRRLGTDAIDLYLLHWKSRYPLAETSGVKSHFRKTQCDALSDCIGLDNPHFGSDGHT